MVEDTPDDLVHELFTQGFWENHPLGRPILGTRGDRRIVQRRICCASISRNAYTPPNLIVSAVGNLEHAHVRDLVEEKFGSLAGAGEPVAEEAPRGRAARC